MALPNRVLLEAKSSYSHASLVEHFFRALLQISIRLFSRPISVLGRLTTTTPRQQYITTTSTMWHCSTVRCSNHHRRRPTSSTAIPAGSIAAPAELQRGIDAPTKLYCNFGGAPTQHRHSGEAPLQLRSSFIAAPAELRRSGEAPLQLRPSFIAAPAELRRLRRSCFASPVDLNCSPGRAPTGDGSVEAALQLRLNFTAAADERCVESAGERSIEAPPPTTCNSSGRRQGCIAARLLGMSCYVATPATVEDEGAWRARVDRLGYAWERGGSDV